MEAYGTLEAGLVSLSVRMYVPPFQHRVGVNTFHSVGVDTFYSLGVNTFHSVDVFQTFHAIWNF